MAASRPLTDGEIRLARMVFGGSIDYATVRVHDGPCLPFQPKNSGMAPNGEIFMHGCYEADYSRTPIETQSLFLHEMTHVWQYQNKVLLPASEAVKLNLKHKFNYAAAYAYRLEAGRDLTSYGMEQQAAIVQEYFMLKNGLGAWRAHCQNRETPEEQTKLYEGVLGNFFKNPAYARRQSFPSSFRR